MRNFIFFVIAQLPTFGVAWGSEKVSDASYQGVTMGTVMETFVALMLVVMAIFASTWLVKRLNPRLRATMSGKNIMICERLMLGNKEQLMIVNVCQKKLLIGVTANQINILKDLTDVSSNVDSVSDNSDDKPLFEEERSLFQRLLERKK